MNHRWRWLGAEFTIIVLGVLSALFVDTWIQERNDAARAAEYRVRLAADLRTDVNEMNARMEYFKRVREFGLAVLEVYEGRGEMSDFDLMFAAFNAAEEWGFSPESSTYTDMQSTGHLALLKDLQFRLGLGRYYRELEARSAVWTPPSAYREVARGIIPNALQAAIHAQCNAEVADIVLLSARAGPGAEQPCRLNPSDYDVAAAATRLRTHPEAEELLRYRVSQLRVAIDLFRNQRIIAERLIEQLAEAE
ncbi:MAG TPA: hypothetical protein VLM41_03320 [Steroidobacteraceae bacterium]|nr:hypothetical protein [Steroidobacteraceae bacterium]